jgi:hypothetical protein
MCHSDRDLHLQRLIKTALPNVLTMNPSRARHTMLAALSIGFRMGTGKPTVFPKWVSRVGTVFDFGAPRHTVYPCHGIAGIHHGLINSR